MICPNKQCRQEIPDNSLFCPDCGSPISKKHFTPESIRHLKHLNLIPTSMEKWPWTTTGSWSIVATVVGVLVALFLGAFGIAIPGEEYQHCKYNELGLDYSQFFLGIALILAAIIVLFACYYFLKFATPFKKKALSDITDFVEKFDVRGSKERPADKYAIFVKDGKCGVLNVRRYKISVKAQYTSLTWRDKDKYLLATLDDETFIIDVNGKKIM